jgi:hypothetical protein
MTIIAAIILAVFCILVLALPRQYATVPIVLSFLYLTEDQIVVIAGQHVYGSTIVAIFCFLRLIIKHEFFFRDTDKITLSIVSWAIIALITCILLSGLEGYFNRIRIILTIVIYYIFIKSTFKSFDEIIAIFKFLPFFIAPVAVCMILESHTGHSVFGTSERYDLLDDIRNGRYRCQGPFSIPILAGTFGATVMPIMVILWFQASYKKTWCILGLVSSVIITFTANTSGALSTFILEIMAFGFWYLRNQMHWVRRGLVALLIALMVTMKAPVWYLFTKLSDAAGGGGWHRSRLLEVAFGPNFHEWWLFGTKYTRHWMPNVLRKYPMADITNQYLYEGVDGGIFTMAFFIFIIVCCFKAIGNSLHRNENAPLRHTIFLWGLGVTLFGHVVSFMSISYFDQSIIWYYLLIGMIGAVSAVPLLNEESIHTHITAGLTSPGEKP